jgi:hypothetical protein
MQIRIPRTELIVVHSRIATADGGQGALFRERQEASEWKAGTRMVDETK